MLFEVTVDFLIGAETPEEAKKTMEQIIMGEEMMPRSYRIHPETKVMNL